LTKLFACSRLRHVPKLETGDKTLPIFRRKPVPQKTPDWYYAAATEDRIEYDAFGPWVSEITKEIEMPPRFRFAYATHCKADFLLKVPVQADRRQMRPGMDLYIAVLAISQDGISIYRLVQNDIVSDHYSWGSIAAVRNGANLLNGTFSLVLTNGSEVELSFNTVSRLLMETAADFVRKRCVGLAQKARLSTFVSNIAVTDHFFQAMLSMMQRRGPAPMSVAHFEAPGQRCLDHEGRRRTTTGLLLLMAPSELIVVNRDRPANGLWHANYSAITTCIPLAHIKRYAFVPADSSASRPRFHALHLRLGELDLAISCLRIPDDVLVEFENLAIPRI
jgi:hypothetical protein